MVKTRIGRDVVISLYLISDTVSICLTFSYQVLQLAVLFVKGGLYLPKGMKWAFPVSLLRTGITCHMSGKEKLYFLR